MSDVVSLALGLEQQEAHQDALSPQDIALMNRVVLLPLKILERSHQDGLSLAVLHEIAHASHFNLKRAAYLIDNPDFDHMVGVAGFAHEECVCRETDVWNLFDTAHNELTRGSFHKNMRGLRKPSLMRHNKEFDQSELQNLAHLLGFQKPDVITWSLPEDNYGILLFEDEGTASPWRRELLKKVVALFGFAGKQ